MPAKMPSNLSSTNLPFALWDLAEIYKAKYPDFEPKELFFHRKVGAEHAGVHLADLKTPISLCLSFQGRLLETLSIIPMNGSPHDGSHDHIIFGWRHLRDVYTDDPSLVKMPLHNQTIPHIAYLLANQTRLFLTHNWGPCSSDSIWYGKGLGGQDLDFNKLILVSLRNSGPGVWQPIFAYGDRFD
ncbi:hypothetical protein SISNIDRAFT_464692 [Sistotremastrum niveocremeum HHB9708]|uniref:Uncharacterized protein n=1 Tax=Sistotremastrum niveocremeum HHB9708 TaxID=1314777 RepID=A0A164WG40_9AGAM|nr:hypothetical protein SISNIDRAFT_464692 [Sistotremastrum niveocremeum HHB9708]